ncbi:glutamate-5-semialdehyde dehydrogenase [Brevibacillus sp. SYP-B805]|uniref:glutamate-5-semialdehyde dehydrogenase n=1 Tax=Brevibacillus sp. SYP-B805 TaxID=1578199 RepID=UPI001F499B2C|nr:glutamate-5-semialdehyde dehydrogenase [Brevibacillus sp. SYP-B805]
MRTTASALREQVEKQAKLAKQASRQLARLSSADKNNALLAIARQLIHDQAAILAANAEDVERAKEAGLPASYLDRLLLTDRRMEALAASLQELAALPDPVGEVITSWQRPNGLQIEQVRVPLGVIGMVYEARPNVTVEAAAIALKTNNAIVLRGSRTALRSNLALVESIRSALNSLNLPAEAIQYLSQTEHEAIDILCSLNGLVDVMIPRGGAELINRVVRSSSVPVLETGVGNCHIFIDQSADYDMAEAIVLNAKTSRPAVCNAAETLLIHREWPLAHQQALLQRLHDAGVELRACEQTRSLHSALSSILRPADEQDWDTEYLDLILAVRTVGGVDEAIAHIAEHGTGHSEAIITRDERSAEQFLARIDAAAVYHNASTRFTDGGEFGFGAEIGISTQKIHARGPMGLHALTSCKYLIRGSGQIR